MSSKKRVEFKRCAVLNCASYSATNQEVDFVFVPRNRYRRKNWLKKMKAPFLAQKMYCCDLHFNLEEDCINYREYKQQSGEKKRYLKLKGGVLPHKNLPSTTEISESYEIYESANSVAEPREKQRHQPTEKLPTGKPPIGKLQIGKLSIGKLPTKSDESSRSVSLVAVPKKQQCAENVKLFKNVSTQTSTDAPSEQPKTVVVPADPSEEEELFFLVELL